VVALLGPVLYRLTVKRRSQPLATAEAAD
jgi:hypothetical protein